MYRYQLSRRYKRASATAQTGSVLVEFKLIAMVVLLLFPLTLQLGLVYHAKLVLNYAVFEAARRGAVNNARVSIMRDELGIRLAPLHGGDGSAEAALLAVAQSTLATRDVFSTQISILNPTPAAFKDWGVVDAYSNRRIIPNAHIRHQTDSVGPQSGVNLQDANLLKVQVVFGVQLRVPFAGPLIARVMARLDPKNVSFYLRRKFPLTSVATVRMQSDAWETEILDAATAEQNHADALPTVAYSPGIPVAENTQLSEETDPLATSADTSQSTASVSGADTISSSQSVELGSGQDNGTGGWANPGDCADADTDRAATQMLVSTADYLDYLHEHLP